MKKQTKKLINELCNKLANADLCYYHGTFDAISEAHAILIHVLELTHYRYTLPEFISIKDALLSHEICDKRICTQKPLAYIINTAFMGPYTFYVNENVMIPTSPIGHYLLSKPNILLSAKTAMDLCTGSGALAIVAQKNLNLSAPVDAVDISTKALKVAKKNIAMHNADVNLIESDLFTNVKNKYDLIISNPPYVPIKSYNKLAKEFTFEPKLAFISQDNGLDIPLKIIKYAKRYLSANGMLILEVGEIAKALEVRLNYKLKWINSGPLACGVCLLTAKELNKLTLD